jgi:hypothetical protein
MSMIFSRKGKRRAPRWIGWAIAAGAFLFLIPFYYFDRMDLARPSLFGAIAIALAAATLWRLRVHRWFWIAIAMVIALHVYAILRLAWDQSYIPQFVIVTISLIDYGAVVGFIKLIELICRDTEESPRA